MTAQIEPVRADLFHLISLLGATNGSLTLHGTGTRTGTGKRWVIISLCSVHTTQGQGQGTIVFYCAHLSPCRGPGSVQYV